MAQGNTQFTKSCLPPGLEGSSQWEGSSSSPAKIQVGDTLKFLASGGPVPDTAVLSYAPQCATQGEWMNAVMATAPYLDAQGLHFALGILDCAIANVQRTKALDVIIARGRSDAEANAEAISDEAEHISMDDAYTAEIMRAQICQQQHVLLQQLHCLRDGAQMLDTALAARVPPAMNRDGKPKPFAAAETQSPNSTPPSRRGAGPNIAITERVLGALGHPSKPQRSADTARGHSGAAAATTSEGTPAFQSLAAPAPQKPSFDRPPRGSGRQAQTLSSSLQLLVNEDPDCLFIVRRINKLGFKACRKLKQHFSSYGTVVRVLVAHSTVRQHGDPQYSTRRRPSSLGFVQMAASEAVKKILAMGGEQEVDGSIIRVQRFERQPNGHDEEEAEGEPEENLGFAQKALDGGRDGFTKDADWNRQHSAYSSVSTRTTASTCFSVESDAVGLEE